MSDGLSDLAMMDEVAKEIFVRRIHAVKNMKDYELVESIADCYHKARIFVQQRKTEQAK